MLIRQCHTSTSHTRTYVENKIDRLNDANVCVVCGLSRLKNYDIKKETLNTQMSKCLIMCVRSVQHLRQNVNLFFAAGVHFTYLYIQFTIRRDRYIYSKS